MKQKISIALLQYGEGFAILKRTEGKYTFPGGKVDGGESPEAAVLREVLEETELKAFINRDLGIDTVSNPSQERYYFLCTASSDQIVLREPDKFTQARWMSARDVLDTFGDRLYPSIRDFLEQEVSCKYKEKESLSITPLNVLPSLSFAKYADGCVPVVLQDAARKTVLALDWMNNVSVEETLNSGQISTVAADCDLDTLIFFSKDSLRASDFEFPIDGPLNYSRYSDGLLPAIVQDSQTKNVLMVAFMNAAALEKSMDTKMATFFTRSRQRLWTKGEESGNFMKVTGISTNKELDAVLMQVEPQGNGVACHTGQVSCFYRRFGL
jgi:phosphoribosyl-AMP cyclohydrolase